MNRMECVRGTALVLVALLGAGSLAACGDSGSGPSGPGKVSVVMTDTPASSSSPARAPAEAAQAGFSGTFSGTVKVQISQDGNNWVDVGSPASVTVDLQSDSSTTVQSEQDVAGGDYSHIRVIFSSASADLEAGSVVGGVSFPASVSVSVGSGSDVTVTHDVFPFTVGSNQKMEIYVDLNSEGWITAQAAQSGSAPASQLQSAVVVESRAG